MKTSNLIIGSNSFLGIELAKKIHQDGHQVTGVYNKNKNNLYPKIDHVPITNLNELEDNYDTVFIVSAFVPNNGDQNPEKPLFDANISLVKKISLKFKSAKLVFCSTVSVFYNSDTVIAENSITAPTSPYGISKLWGESIIKNHKRFSIVRISSMFGINMKPTTFLPLVVKSALTKGEITLFGDGSRKQNYIHVSDVASYLYKASRISENKTFLAVSPTSHSNLEVAHFIKRLLPKTTIKFHGTDDSNSYFYNNELTNENISFIPNKRLESELDNIIRWVKKEF